MSWLLKKRYSLLIYHFKNEGSKTPQVIETKINVLHFFRSVSALFEDLDDLSANELRELTLKTFDSDQEEWVKTALMMLCDKFMITNNTFERFISNIKELSRHVHGEAKQELKQMNQLFFELNPANFIVSSSLRDHHLLYKNIVSVKALGEWLNKQNDYIEVKNIREHCDELSRQDWRSFSELKESILNLGMY